MNKKFLCALTICSLFFTGCSKGDEEEVKEDTKVEEATEETAEETTEEEKPRVKSNQSNSDEEVVNPDRIVTSNTGLVMEYKEVEEPKEEIEEEPKEENKEAPKEEKEPEVIDNSPTVYIHSGESASKTYHSELALRDMPSYSTTTMNKATTDGYTPCKTCFPDEYKSFVESNKDTQNDEKVEENKEESKNKETEENKDDKKPVTSNTELEDE